MPERKIKEMIKTPGRYTILVDKNLKVKVIDDMHTIYTIEVDKNFNNMKAWKNNEEMDKVKVQHPNNHNPREPSDMAGLPPELDAGCIALGALVRNPNDLCIWKVDHWW